jgi:hypothetical protein
MKTEFQTSQDVSVGANPGLRTAALLIIYVALIVMIVVARAEYDLACTPNACVESAHNLAH